MDPQPGAANNPTPAGESTATAVLVPVKSFGLAKGRLADALDREQRSALARTMAARVVAAAAPLPVFVVCGSDEVASWATARGAEVLRFEPPGLNPAVAFGTAELHRLGFRTAIVAHGDLPLARSLAPVADFDGVTIVPDRRDDGTNVMAVPLGRGFTFRYGAGSAPAHRDEAIRLGLPYRLLHDPELGLDIDIPDDLLELDRAAPPQEPEQT